MKDELRNDAIVDEDMLKGRFLTFAIGKELFGLETRYVTEIVGIQEIVEMPEMPHYIKGIINLRGKIIPLMSVRARFSKEQRVNDDRTCIIIIDFSGIPIGLIVDSVSEVLVLSDEEIVEAPQSATGMSNRYVEKIGKTDSGIIMLLNCGRLLTETELQETESSVITASNKSS